MTTVREDNRTNPLPRPPNPEFSPSNSLSCFFYFPTCFSIMYSYCYFFSKLLLLVVVFLLPIMEEEVLALPCHPWLTSPSILPAGAISQFGERALFCDCLPTSSLPSVLLTPSQATGHTIITLLPCMSFVLLEIPLVLPN